MMELKPSAVDIDLSSAKWISSSYGTNIADPVQIAFVGENIVMRNGNGQDSVVLVFTQAEWDAFVAGALDGEFDYER